MSWQRARTEEKKTERKEAIYQAALKLFKDHGYDKVSLNSIAREAKFSKSNLYRYFSSREEIYLNIFSDLFVEWSEECITQLQKTSAPSNAEQVARLWVSTTKKYPSLLDLAPLLFHSLEQNSSYEQLLSFKSKVLQVVTSLTRELIRLLPTLGHKEASKLIITSHATLASAWAAAKYNETLASIYQLEPYKDLTPDFDHDAVQTMEVIIYGCLEKSNKD